MTINDQAAEIEAIASEQVEFDEVTPSAITQDDMPETSEVLLPVLQMGFGILAPNWNVQPEETEQLADCYGQLLDKYVPNGIGDHGVEITALMVTAAIFLPRSKMPRKLEPVKEVSAAGQEVIKKDEPQTLREI